MNTFKISSFGIQLQSPIVEIANKDYSLLGLKENSSSELYPSKTFIFYKKQVSQPNLSTFIIKIKNKLHFNKNIKKVLPNSKMVFFVNLRDD